MQIHFSENNMSDLLKALELSCMCYLWVEILLQYLLLEYTFALPVEMKNISR